MFRTVSKKSRKSHNFAYEQCNNFSSYFTRTFKHGLYTMYSLLLCILLILAVAQACRFMLGWESTLQFFEQIAHFFVSKRAICSWKRANCSHRSFKRATEQRATEGIRSRPLFKMSSFEWKNEERKSKKQKSKEQKSERAKEQKSKRAKDQKRKIAWKSEIAKE